MDWISRENFFEGPRKRKLMHIVSVLSDRATAGRVVLGFKSLRSKKRYGKYSSNLIVKVCAKSRCA